MKRNRTVTLDIETEKKAMEKLKGKSFSELLRNLLKNWLDEKSAHK